MDASIMEKVSEAWMISGGIISEKEIKEEDKDKFCNFYSFRINETVDIAEDYECEYKEIKGQDFRNHINSTITEYSVSFLNGRGGAIYYGITDDRIIKGVKLTLDDIDEVNRLIYNNISNIHPAISPDYFEINFHPVHDEKGQSINNLYVIEVIIPMSPIKTDIYICNGTELHVRVKSV